MGTINGNQNPEIGVINFYEISILNSLPFLNPKGDVSYEWYLFKKQKSGRWINITKDGIPKTGVKVSYKFFEAVVGKLFEIRVYEIRQGVLPTLPPVKNLLGKLRLMPVAGNTAQIEKVVLFNRGKKEVNKADYRDLIIAQAFCTGLFGKEIEFQLWEDDAAGEGHNPLINKNNRIPKVYKAMVNEKGIAESKISLSADERIMRRIANRFLMRGDENEGTHHEYYVTATYLGTGEKASKANVNVKNPDKDNSNKAGLRTNSAKFPATPISKITKHSDAKGKILDAYFVNVNGHNVSRLFINDWVKIRINSKNMTGKKVQYVIWEYDAAGHDEILRKDIMLTEPFCDTPTIKIDPAVFGKGYSTNGTIFGKTIDDDCVKQNYFIEVIPMDVSAESRRFGLDHGGLMQVEKEKVKSAAMVKETKQNTSKKERCFCNRDFEEKDVRKLVKLLKGSEIIWEGQTLKNGKKVICTITDKSFATLTNELNRSFKKYNINTCAQKMHFLAQACEETGTFTLSEETKSKYASSLSIYKGRGILQLTGIKRNKSDEMYNDPGPYKSYADHLGNQEILRNPGIIATHIHYALDSGAWIWSINKKMPKAPSAAVDRWGIKTSGKSLNELALYEDEYLELISVLLNGRGSNGMPNGWSSRQNNYNLLKNGFFNYEWYHNKSSDATQNVKDIITYIIYYGGKIEKHIPKVIKTEYKRKYKYVYKDKNNKENVLGIFNFKLTAEMNKGNIPGRKMVELVDIREFTGYDSNGIRLKFKTLNTDSKRYFINPDCYAGLLGAMADMNIDYLGFNGFSNFEAKSTGGSSSHRNGEKGDLRYLSKNKNGEATILQDIHFDVTSQNKFNDALYSFGWGRLEKMYSEYFTYNGQKRYLLNHTKHMMKLGKKGYRHYHHLHLSGFDHSLINIIKYQ